MKILIVEDEPQTAQMLKSIILKLRPNAIIQGISDSIENTVAVLKIDQPDLIFMDIQLADGVCFDIFSLADVKSPVAFCTAYDQYMLEAFKTNGIDYLLKPAKEEDVEKALLKFESLKQTFGTDQSVIELIQSLTKVSQQQYKKTLLVQYRESYIPLAISDVAIFLVENEILYAYTFNQQRYTIFRPLSEIETELNPLDFFRINRQTLINRQAVKEIQPYFNRKMSVHISVKLPETLVVSRLKVPEFMKWMENA